MRVFEDCQNLSQDRLREKYSRCYQEMRVDRVLFIASANGTLPEKLLACTMRAAQPGHRMELRRGSLSNKVL